MPAFAVTGPTTTLGRLVVAGLGGAAAVANLEPFDRVALEGVDALVSLAVGCGPARDGAALAERLAELRRVLAAADGAGLRRVVHVSSAVVYGAAADNAVPLTEDAPLRPDPAFAWAAELAEAERLVDDWRAGAPDRSAAVLRPALVVAAEEDQAVLRALGGLTGPRVAGRDRPVQFVHVEDVASAVVLCATSPTPVDGPLNVAPAGWTDDGQAAALAGAVAPPPRVPERLVGPVRHLLWLLRIGATPPRAATYVTHPWVVAADRLRALGWVPAHTTEEALVATTSCSALATLTPRRRQQIILVVVTVVATALLLIPVAATLRAIRRTWPQR